MAVHCAPLSILTAADGGYVPFLAAQLYSLATNGGAAVPLDITVLHRDICQSDRSRLESLIRPPHRVRWLEVTAALCREAGAPIALSAAKPTYFRLLAPYVLPRASRVVYLDADTIVVGSMEPLATISLEGCAVGAVLDWLPRFRDAVGNWRQLGLDGDAPYFNSGVLVIDIGRWVDEAIAPRALEICSRHSEFLLAQGKWAQYDQYGLNIVIRGRWHALPGGWNHFTERPADPETPRVLHYVGQGKPGSARCLPEFTALFDATVARTPWSGWRPARSVIPR